MTTDLTPLEGDDFKSECCGAPRCDSDLAKCSKCGNLSAFFDGEVPDACEDCFRMRMECVCP